MEVVFADTVYWQALLDVQDDLHEAAVSITRQLKSLYVRFITSEMVLTEVLNAFGRPERGRKLATDLVQSLRADVTVEIVLNAECPFETAFDLYLKRPDKQWGHTDCSSFLIMQSRGIQNALTHDKHFTQAGFTILL